MLVVGKSGSGKSNVLMSQIIRRLRAGQELYVIDTKNEIGPIFKRYLHKLVKPDGAVDLMKKMLEIAQDRNCLFEEAADQYERPVRDLDEYHKVTGVKLPVVCLVVEELIVLMDLIPQDELIKLLVLGRSAGVFVLALSQYLTAKILERKGAVNFNHLIFLGKFDRISIDILFGSLDVEVVKEFKQFLGAPGRAMVEVDGTLLEPQVMPRVQDTHLIPYMKRS